jgi:autotransporter translocation and assembly factor TamB
MVKTGWKIIKLLTLVLVLGTMVTVLLLMTPPGNYLLMKIAQHQLTHWLGYPVSMERLRTNLISHIRINNFALQDSSDYHAPILTCARFEIRYNLLPLLAAKVAIRELRIDRPRLVIIRDASGRVHLPARLLAANPDSTSPKPTDRDGFKFDLQKLIIQNLDVAAHDFSDSVTIELLGVNGNLHASNSSGDLVGNLTATGGSFSWSNLRQDLRRLSLSFRFQHGDFTLTDFHLATDDLMAQASGTYSLDQRRLANAHLALDLQLAALNRIGKQALTLPDAGYTGILTLAGHFDGRLDRPEGIITARLVNGKIQHVPIENFQATITLREQQWQVDSLLLAALSGKITAAGAMLLHHGELSYQLHLAVRHFQIQALLQQIYHQNSSSLRGAIAGELSLQGSGGDWQQLQAYGELNLSQLSLDDHPLDNMHANFHLDRGELRFNLNQNGSAIRFLGRVQDSLVAGSVTGQLESITALATLANVPHVQGKLSFAGQLAGALTAPEARLNFQLWEGSYFGVPIDSLNGGLSFHDQAVILSNITARGSIEDFRALNRYLEIDSLAGTASYTIVADGPLDDLQASIHVNWNNGRIATIRFDSLQVHLKNQGPKLVIERFDLKQRQQRLQLSGHLDWRERLATELTLQVLELDTTQQIIANGGRLELRAMVDHQSVSGALYTDSLALEPVMQLLNLPTDLHGTLKTDLTFRGYLQAPKLDGELEVIDGTINLAAAQRIDSLQLKLLFQERGFEIRNLVGKIGSLGFTAAGKGVIEDEQNFDLTLSCHAPQIGSLQFTTMVQDGEILAGQLRLDRLDLSQLALIAPTKAPRLNGLLNLAVDLAGQIAAPQMTVNMTSDRVTIEQTTIDSLYISGRYDQQMISFQESGFKIGTGRIHLAGTLPMQLTADNQPLVALDSLKLVTYADDLDIGWLKSLFPSFIGLTGKASFELTMTGSLHQPTLNGSLRLSQGGLNWPDITPAIGNLSADLRCQDNRIRINRFAGELGRGTFYLTGGLDIDRFRPTNINLSLLLNQINLKSPSLFDLGIERGELHLTQTDQQFRLQGQIQLAETKYLQDFRPRVRDFLTRVPYRSADHRNQFFDQLVLDVIIQGQENVWIDNNLAKIQLSANLNVSGTANQPNLAGRIVVHKGYVLYLDRKFKITQGVIDFNDPERINPLIQLTATCSLTDYQTELEKRYEIMLKLMGTLDKPNFELSASPSLDRADIIALLTVGRTRRDLFPTAVNSQRESLQEVMFSRFKEITSQRLAGITEQKLSETLALDNISIEGNLFQMDKSWGPRITATKHLSNRINLTYSTVIGQTNDQQIRLGYQLYKFISVVGNTGQRGQSGLDLKFNFKFY